MSRRFALAALCAAATAAAVVAVPQAASAAGGEQGYLLIRGVGSLYAKSAPVSIVSTPGGTATYAFEVKNSGTGPAQYNVAVSIATPTCPTGCGSPTLSVTAGGVFGNVLAQGPSGYYTVPIGPGKTVAYSLKVKLPSDANKHDQFPVVIVLKDTAGNALSGAAAVTDVTGTSDDSSYDHVMTAPGEKPIVSGNPNTNSVVGLAPAAMKPNTSVALKAKLLNDGPSAATIGYRFTPVFPGCNAAEFPFTAKVGTADVTSAVENGTYRSATLAHGQSVTLTLTIKYLPSQSACPGSPELFYSSSDDGFGDHRDSLVSANPAAS